MQTTGIKGKIQEKQKSCLLIQIDVINNLGSGITYKQFPWLKPQGLQVPLVDCTDQDHSTLTRCRVNA